MYNARATAGVAGPDTRGRYSHSQVLLDGISVTLVESQVLLEGAPYDLRECSSPSYSSGGR